MKKQKKKKALSRKLSWDDMFSGELHHIGQEELKRYKCKKIIVKKKHKIKETDMMMNWYLMVRN